MIIIEIILTIVAWRKGWRWLALIPVSVAFCIGIVIGSSGGPIDPLTLVIWDILAIIALVVMVVVKPSNNKPIEPPTPPVSPTV
jgi:hypothetical protein